MPKSTDKAKMQPRHPSPPGLETDGHGKVIPVEKRTAEDREKVARAQAGKKKA